VVTIKDIAKKSGYSITTVSRALNGFDDVNEETRKKIQKVAEELQYYPNAIARRLVKKGYNTFGYIVCGLQRGEKHSIIQEFLSAIYDFANKVEYEILIMTVDSRKKSPKSYLQFAKEHNLSGIIVSGITTDEPYYRELQNSEIPCVYNASRDVVTYLYDKGHRNIAYMNGKSNASVSMVRYSGYVDRMRELGLKVSMDYVLHGDFSEKIAYQEAKEFLQKHPEVTAFFCASDLMAVGLIKAARELGIKVPEQLSVVGFDNIPIAEYTSPPLTTVRQDFYQMGYEATQMLYSIINKQDIPHIKKLSYELVERSSVSMI
jgi:LacI family transcriptional regulator